MTLGELKLQKRWILWRLEMVPGKDKPTKIPRQPNGYKASLLNPKHLYAYEDLVPYLPDFSGIGLALGLVDGVFVGGVDIDACCDAVTGKFTAESRQVVIGLDSYSEFSPSGTGCHIWVVADSLPGPGLQKPFPGCKQIEVKGQGYYHTYTGRHLGKTPATLEYRQEQITALYHRAAATARPKSALVLVLPQSEAERFQKLMAGDMSDHENNHSVADYALCCLLAKKHGGNAFKVDEEFRKSGLCRDKWEREDYREGTITRAVAAVLKESAIVFDMEEPLDEDTPREFVIDPLPKCEDGWFPLGEVSLVGGPSGAGKTHGLLRILEDLRGGRCIFGHTVSTKPTKDYLILLHDRSSAAMRSTVRAGKLSVEEVMRRVIRLSPAQQKERPAVVVEAAIQSRPGVKIIILEGLDFWTPDIHKLDVVGTILDELQRVAKQYNIAVIATLGSPKQKENDRYASGRDQFMGSVAFGRKSETCISIEQTSDKQVRKMNVMLRNAAGEQFFFTWTEQGVSLTTEPAQQAKKVDENTAISKMERRVFMHTGDGEELRYVREWGPWATFHRWRQIAEAEGKVVKSGKKWYRSYPDEQTEGVSVITH